MSPNRERTESPVADQAADWGRLMAEWRDCAEDVERMKTLGDADGLQAALERSEALKGQIGACIDGALQKRTPAKLPLTVVNLPLPSRGPSMNGLFQRIFARAFRVASEKY